MDASIQSWKMSFKPDLFKVCLLHSFRVLKCTTVVPIYTLEHLISVHVQFSYRRLNQNESFHSHVAHSNWYQNQFNSIKLSLFAIHMKQSYVRLLDSLYSLLQVNLLRDKDLENYLKRPVAHIWQSCYSVR